MALHIKNIEEKNEELNDELIKKENMNEMLMKENEKLTGENNLYKNQVEQCNHQINELNNIIKHKDNIINNLKSENLSNEKLLNKSSSYSIIKLNETNEFFNENISKLISDNEENKIKIELLNDKIKNIDQIEKKYTEIINNNRALAFQINSNNTSPNNSNIKLNYKNYNLINNTNFRSFVSPKKLQLDEANINLRSPKKNINEKKES